MGAMRRMLVAALVLAPLAAAPAPAAARQAQIVPAKLSPLEVRGTGFRRWERVRVTVTPVGGEPVTRRVRAGRDGSFRVGFEVDTGGGIEAAAAGRRGSRASFSLAF